VVQPARRRSWRPPAKVCHFRGKAFDTNACVLGGLPTQAIASAKFLLFGRNIGDRARVSEREWVRFVDREIAPRFPDGLTVLNASGRWREPRSGKIIRERSKVVQIVLPGQAADLSRLDEVAEAYKRRFKQRSVGLIVRPACVSF
jgi:Protein of unknown function (DUF3574)